MLIEMPRPRLEDPGFMIHRFRTPSISSCAGQTFFRRSNVLRASNNRIVTNWCDNSGLYLRQELLAPPAALVVLLDLGPALDDGVILGQELFPLVLPQLGRGDVQVNVVPTPEKLIASE